MTTTLGEDDYLTFQLFLASKSPKVRRSRIFGWMGTTAGFLVLAYVFYANEIYLLAIYFLVISGASLVFYPSYSRWRYKRHYTIYVRENFRKRFGVESTIEFRSDAITIKDKTMEVKIDKSEIEEVHEILDFYFIKTRTGTHVIIAKASTAPELIRNEIKNLVAKGVRHNVELDWKWK